LVQSGHIDRMDENKEADENCLVVNRFANRDSLLPDDTHGATPPTGEERSAEPLTACGSERRSARIAGAENDRDQFGVGERAMPCAKRGSRGLSVGMQNSPLVGIEFSPPIIDREIADGRESSGGRGRDRRTG
jgi:hypothetical protein